MDICRPAPPAALEEPLYAVPRKEHQSKFTIEDFVLHKMLGKGSFGKVLDDLIQREEAKHKYQI